LTTTTKTNDMKRLLKSKAELKRLYVDLELNVLLMPQIHFPAIATWASGQYEYPQVEFVFVTDFREKTDKVATIEEIAQIVASMSIIYDIEDIKGLSRIPGLMDLRRIIVHKAKEAGYSYPEIGKYLNRTHATVIQTIKSYECYVKYDSVFASFAAACEAEIDKLFFSKQNSNL